MSNTATLGHAVDDEQRYRHMMHLINGHWFSMALATVAKFSIPDALKDGPRSAASLAGEKGLNTLALTRVMRALAPLGVFDEPEEGTFALTELGSLLRADHSHTLKNFTQYVTEPYHWDEWLALPHTVKTGETAFDHAEGKPFYAFMKEHPQEQSVFNDAVANIGTLEARVIVDAYDFSGYKKLMDCAGGIGRLLVAILGRHKNLHGILFDLPHVINQAEPFVKAAGLGDRYQLIPGSFFDSVPSGADAIIIKRTLWAMPDDQARVVLKHLHQALPKGGKLLIIEGFITRDAQQNEIPTLFDLLFMTENGGRVKSVQEYHELLEAAGFKNMRLVPIRYGISILESEAA